MFKHPYHTTIPTYVINLPERTDRLVHTKLQFEGKNEFNVKIIDACKHEIGAFGLWLSICKIIRIAVENNEEAIIICEDDHEFTDNYSSEKLLDCIAEAKSRGADILCGSVSWFKDALEISENLFWMNLFTGTQFIILFQEFFNIILKAVFNTYESADYKICSLTNKIFCISSFISIQKEFGYSDVTEKNNSKQRVEELFIKSSANAQILKDVTTFYKNKKLIGDKNEIAAVDHFVIPTYIINQHQGIERKKHIEKQFAGRCEFDIKIVEDSNDNDNSIGLWKNIQNIIHMAIKDKDDVIIICYDSHEFTTSYSKDFFIKNIISAHSQGADCLFGSVGNFGHAVPISENRFWISPYSSTHFIVLYSKFFSRVIDEPFDDNMIADTHLSEMTSNKMVLYPFISTPKFFDSNEIVLEKKDIKKLSYEVNKSPSRRLEIIMYAFKKYNNKFNNIWADH